MVSKFYRWQSVIACLVVSLFAIYLNLIPNAFATSLNPQVKILKNGLEVIVLEMPRAPVAAQYLFYKVGGMDDYQGKSGLAHVLEHMMFKGTKKFGDGVFSANISKMGGQDNAFTSQDVTAYHQIVPAEKIALAMEMEADRMRNLNFADKSFRWSSANNLKF